MIWAPSSSSASLRRLFTVAWVPTGMNTGVSIAPCGVLRRARRAPVASVRKTSNEKFTPPVYQQQSHQEKIQARPILHTTKTPQTASTMANALPVNFFGLTAVKPIEIRNIVQMLKMSIDFPSDISALGVLSGRNEPRLVAIGLSRSTVPGAFKKRIKINSKE